MVGSSLSLSLLPLLSRLSFQIPHFLLAFGISDSNFGFVVSHFGLGLRHCDALIAGLPGSPPPLFRSLNTNFMQVRGLARVRGA